MTDNGLPDEPAHQAEPAEPNENKSEKPGNKQKEPLRFSLGALITVSLVLALVAFMTTYVVLSQSYVHKLNSYIAGGESGSDSFMSKVDTKLASLDKTVRDEYLHDDEIDEDALLDGVLKGYMGALGDKYAAYYNKEEFALLQSDESGEMQGIGINVTFNTEYNCIEVLAVFPDTPAEKAGLEPGDLIAYVKDTEDYLSVASIGYNKAVSLIKGEVGTNAEFVVLRGEGLSEQIEFSVERAEITEYTVSSWHYSLDEAVGIIRITSFDSKTPGQFSAALGKLQSDGITSLILDVRYNPGGELNSVCSILDKLVPEGAVVRTVDRDGNEEVVYTSDAQELNLPMAVLVNGNTASAGELFSACLRDYEKALLVGTKTYGKGSMQTVKAFGDGTGVKYTYRYYCPPKTDNYDGVGLTPDVKVELSENLADINFYKIKDSDDNQIAAAVELIKNTTVN